MFIDRRIERRCYVVAQYPLPLYVGANHGIHFTLIAPVFE